MTVIDILAFIAYPLVVVNLGALVWYFSSSLLFQIKNRVILTLMIAIYVVASAWGIQQFVNLYRRYQVVFQDMATSPTSVPFIVLQVIIALGLTWINYLLYSKNTGQTVPLRFFKRAKKKDDNKGVH